MRWPIVPNTLRVPENDSLLYYLDREQPSAHSDLVDELVRGLEGQRGFHLFCPAPTQFSYCLAHTEKGIVFALATGMRAISVRVPPELVAEARSDGGLQHAGLADIWLQFEAFSSDTAALRARLRKWLVLALERASQQRPA